MHTKLIRLANRPPQYVVDFVNTKTGKGFTGTAASRSQAYYYAAKLRSKVSAVIAITVRAV